MFCMSYEEAKQLDQVFRHQETYLHPKDMQTWFQFTQRLESYLKAAMPTKKGSNKQ